MSYIVGSSQQLIGKQVLSGTSATITFSNIPQNFNHLKIIMLARSDKAGVPAVNAAMIFNGDSGANYAQSSFYGVNNATVGTGSNPTTNNVLISAIPAATSTASYPGMAEILIPCYAATTFYKVVNTAVTYNSSSAGSNYLTLNSSTWRNTAAITSLAISDSASANFIAGSSFYLYGII